MRAVLLRQLPAAAADPRGRIPQLSLSALLPPWPPPQITSLLLLALKQVPEALAQYEAHARLLRCATARAAPGSQPRSCLLQQLLPLPAPSQSPAL